MTHIFKVWLACSLLTLNWRCDNERPAYAKETDELDICLHCVGDGWVSVYKVSVSVASMSASDDPTNQMRSV